LKVTNKNGKNLSPVGFVTFANRVDAETAKQELTVAIQQSNSIEINEFIL